MSDFCEPEIVIFKSPIGSLHLHFYDQKLQAIRFDQPQDVIEQATSTIAKQTIQQLTEYFTGQLQSFSLPVQPEGTIFQQQVWQNLLQIPYGETWTYGDLASQLKTSPRAIGNACRANPIPIVIPCHRIIAQNNIGGYAGRTSGQKIDIKTSLLEREACFSSAVLLS